MVPACGGVLSSATFPAGKGAPSATLNSTHSSSVSPPPPLIPANVDADAGCTASRDVDSIEVVRPLSVSATKNLFMKETRMIEIDRKIGYLAIVKGFFTRKEDSF